MISCWPGSLFWRFSALGLIARAQLLRPRFVHCCRLTRIMPPESRARMSPYPPRGSAAVENRRRSYWSLTWFQKAGAERESLHQTRIEVHPRTLRSDLGRGGSRSHRGHLRPRNSSVPSYRPTTIQNEQARAVRPGVLRKFGLYGFGDERHRRPILMVLPPRSRLVPAPRSPDPRAVGEGNAPHQTPRGVRALVVCSQSLFRSVDLGNDGLD